MEALREIHQRLIKGLSPSYRRSFYDEFRDDSRLIGVVGRRGVGKTTFLLEYIRSNWQESDKALYISADHLYFVENTLLGLVDEFIKQYDGKLLCIDEIHRYQNWNQELKNIYDSYPDLKVIFSGSSSIDLVKGSYDLSRRAELVNMPGFSFREYLEVKTGESFSKYTLREILNNANEITKEISSTPALLGFLNEYFQIGAYPIFFEVSEKQLYWKRLFSVLEKNLYEDISSFYSLDTKNIESLRKIIYYSATSQPGEINTNRLAQSLSHSNSTVSGYLQMLHDAGLLRFLLVDAVGHSLVRNTSKIYTTDTNVLWAINNQLGKKPFLGAVREVFVLSALQDAGLVVSYPRSGGDMAVAGDDGCVLEIGGKSKSKKQIAHLSSEKAWLVKDDTLLSSKGTLPLYIFGFLS